MFDILAVTGPIFLAIGAGALSTRAGLFSQDDLRVMGRFVINLALPCLLFDAVARQHFGDILNGSYLLAYAAGSLATATAGATGTAAEAIGTAAFAAAMAVSSRSSSPCGSCQKSVDQTRCSCQPSPRSTAARSRSRSRAVAAEW